MSLRFPDFAGKINSPLMSINEIENFANNINTAAQNTYNLLEDILMWARTQQGRIPFKPLKLSFADIYKNILEIPDQKTDIRYS